MRKQSTLFLFSVGVWRELSCLSSPVISCLLAADTYLGVTLCSEHSHSRNHLGVSIIEVSKTSVLLIYFSLLDNFEKAWKKRKSISFY